MQKFKSRRTSNTLQYLRAVSFEHRSRFVLLRGCGVWPQDAFDGSARLYRAAHVNPSCDGLYVRVCKHIGIRDHASPHGPNRFVAVSPGEPTQQSSVHSCIIVEGGLRLFLGVRWQRGSVFVSPNRLRRAKKKGTRQTANHTAFCEYMGSIRAISSHVLLLSTEYPNSPPPSRRGRYQRVTPGYLHIFFPFASVVLLQSSTGLCDHLLEQFPGAADQGAGRRGEQSRRFRDSLGRGQCFAGLGRSSDVLVRRAAVG